MHVQTHEMGQHMWYIASNIYVPPNIKAKILIFYFHIFFLLWLSLIERITITMKKDNKKNGGHKNESREILLWKVQILKLI